jgi:hypothetical protein
MEKAMRAELVQVLREPDVDDAVADSIVRRFWSPRRPGVVSAWAGAMAPLGVLAAPRPANAGARRLR